MPVISTRPYYISPTPNFPQTELQKLVASDAQGSDVFGESVAMSGDGSVVIVGAYLEDGVGSNSGAAYAFTETSNVWSEQQKIASDDLASGDRFGNAASISTDGNTAIIGCYFESAGGSGAGASYIFIRSAGSPGVWSQQAKLVATDPQVSDVFGNAVSISSDGDTAIVGARGEDGAGTNRGAAYVYTRSGVTWSPQQKLTASNAQDSDELGTSVAISGDGDAALVGARYASSSSGRVYAYTRTSGVWTQQQILNASDFASNDYFGFSCAISNDGNTAIIGAHGKSSNTGAAYIFTKSGSPGVWTQQQKLTADDAASADQFGISVAISDSGNTAIVGAHQEDGAGSDRGAVYAYTRVGSVWTQQQKLVTSVAVDGARLGYSVAISSDGSTVVSGANQIDSSAGAAYIFV